MITKFPEFNSCGDPLSRQLFRERRVRGQKVRPPARIEDASQYIPVPVVILALVFFYYITYYISLKNVFLNKNDNNFYLCFESDGYFFNFVLNNSNFKCSFNAIDNDAVN